MANIDHLFAFAMAAEDTRLLRELEGIEVGSIANLDNYMCYVRASLGPSGCCSSRSRLIRPPLVMTKEHNGFAGAVSSAMPGPSRSSTR